MEQQPSKFLKLKTANIAAILCIIFSHVCALLLFFVPVPSTNKDLLNFMMGYLLATGMAGAIYYLFNYKKTSEENK